MHDITNGGERAAPDGSWSHYAHLSIYRFAVPYAASRHVLDVGSGTGYGSAYLTQHGASVTALEGSAEAVAFSRAKFGGDCRQVDLNQPLPLPDDSFDVVFSSNVFEHVARIDQLINECARVLRPDGVAIVAVPPITSAAAAEEDMRNRWHVHHIPPWAWSAKLGRWFCEVESYGHTGASRFGLPAGQVAMRETDFDFPAMKPEEMAERGSHTAVFVCRGLRAVPLPESLAEREPAEWCYGALAARIIAETKNETENMFRQSGSWRITAPLRAVVRLIRR